MNATLLVRFTQINHAELSTHVTLFGHALHMPAGLRTQTAYGVLNGEVNRQAQMIAYNDLYRLSMYLILGAALFLPLIRLRRQQGALGDAVIIEA